MLNSIKSLYVNQLAPDYIEIIECELYMIGMEYEDISRFMCSRVSDVLDTIDLQKLLNLN